MKRLTAESTRGIWAGVTMSWDEQYRFDEDTYARNVQRVIDANVHGVYTTGSTGEFYALEHEEFCRMVDIVCDQCGQTDTPLQIGCCSDATGKTLRQFEYVAQKQAVGAVQVNLPYWMELTDREVIRFFKDLYAACPEMPLIHYNIPRAKRFLNGKDYRQVLEVAPSLIGVKYTFAGSHFAELQESILTTPELSYFVGENLLVSAMQLGARGCYSSLIATNPAFMLKMFDLAERGRWEQAIEMQKTAARFFADLDEVLEDLGEGGIDPVADKGLAVASGGLLGHQRCRSPYLGWSDQTVDTVRRWLQEQYPSLVHPECGVAV